MPQKYGILAFNACLIIAYPEINVLHILNIKSNWTFTTGEVSVKLQTIVFKSISFQCDSWANFSSRAVVKCSSCVIMKCGIAHIVLDVTV